MPPCCFEALQLGKNDTDCDASGFPGLGAPEKRSETARVAAVKGWMSETPLPGMRGEKLFS